LHAKSSQQEHQPVLSSSVSQRKLGPVVAPHAQFKPTDADVAKLVDMGFSSDSAMMALTLTFGDMEKSIEWCTRH
jgi:uncharacterized UBP type Zn finger protein